MSLMCLIRASFLHLQGKLLGLKLVSLRTMVGAHVHFQGIEALCRLLAHITVEGFASVFVNVSDVGSKNV